MKPRITVVTIGVNDLERALRFYRDGLGLRTEGIIGKEFEHRAVAFFDLHGGSKLAIWPRGSISHDSGLPLSDPSPTEFTLGHNVSSKAEELPRHLLKFSGGSDDDYATCSAATFTTPSC